MRKATSSTRLLGLALCASSVVSADVVRHPLNVGVSLEQFQFFHTTSNTKAGFPSPLLMVRPTGWVFGSATVDDRLDLVFGLGATLFSIPPTDGVYPQGYQNELYPAVALVQASGTYKWGDLNNPSLKATLGHLPYKYNPDAKNMGEYLLRSTPYPNTVLNSPFDLVSSAQATVLGGILSKNFAGGKWKNDLVLASSNTNYPMGDLSLAYITSYRVHPILEVGAGVSFHRLIPMQSHNSSNESGINAYFTHGGKKLAAGTSKDASGGYYGATTAADTLIIDAVYDSLLVKAPLPASVSDVGYYTFQGQMLMARFALDFKPILGATMAWKLYGEWAMLGVRNYPIFYEKPLERMPMMLGLDIPTFGLLDMLNVEMEYWKNPFLNSGFGASYEGKATPYLDILSYNQASLTSTSQDLKDDDFSWSISATKSFGGAFSVTAKAARDHAQVMQLNAPTISKSYTDEMSGKKSWYYVLRAQVAI